MKTAFTHLDRFAAAGLLAAALMFSAQPVLADKPLKTIPLTVGRHALRVEVTQTDEERSKGLMYRKSLGRDDGMLFIFDDPGYHSMWMMNTLIPLSVAFVDRDGVILNIEDMEPQTTDSHTAAGPAKYAIEANKGWYAEKKIKPGDRVAGLPKLR